MSTHPSDAVIGAVPLSFNMAVYVLGKAQENPNKAALKVVGLDTIEVWTYAEVERAVRTTAAGFQSRGIGTGDRILMRLGNSPDFPITYLAAIWIGAMPIPTSAQLTIPETTAIAAETNPTLIVSAPDIALPTGDWPVLRQHALRDFHDLPPAAAQMGDPNRPAYIIYTSGTSGKPRPVVQAHRAIWARRMMFDGWYGLRSDDVMLHAGAFNWTYTLGTGLMDPWAMGATALIPGANITPEHLPKIIADNQISIFAAAPGIYRRLLKSNVPSFPTLRHGLSAGEKLPQVTAQKWQAATGTPIFEAYGMSECSTFISTRPGKRSTGLGWPQAGRKVALIGPDGPVADGEPGTIAVHKDDPGLMLGYLNAPKETASKFHDDWFLTGDMGRKDPDGAIQYEGRVDEMMNAGGYRVSPIEVEDVITAHPDIFEAAACEISVKSDTSIIAVFYVSVDVIDEGELASHAASLLARYKVPRHFVRIDQLPRGANNKILRRKLRQDWETSHGQT